MIYLKYLGLSADEIKTLKDYIRVQHPKGGMQTASHCHCGSPLGGPNGSVLCGILGKLEDAGRAIANKREPRRDPSVCDGHDLFEPIPAVGILPTERHWRTEGQWYCTRCGTKV